jgi:hypothetical protein
VLDGGGADIDTLHRRLPETSMAATGRHDPSPQRRISISPALNSPTSRSGIYRWQTATFLDEIGGEGEIATVRGWLPAPPTR